MNVAVYTKTTLCDNPVKAKLLKALKAEKSFVVTEIAGFDNLADADRVLVFGGDGTMLYAAKRSDAPVLGVNLGNVGFLAELESDVSPAVLIDAIKSDKVLERFMLTAKCGQNSAVALNETVIKSATARPVSIKLYIDDEYVDSYHSDGLIVSTPTGSTAYSLSAGGPVLAPELDAIIVNPVCPHSLHSRPLVVSSSSKIKLTVLDGEANLVVDGDIVDTISAGKDVFVEKSAKNACFIVADGRNFYKKLLQKMNRWGTTV